MLANTPAMLECHYGVPMTAACSTRSTRGSTPRSSPSRSTTPRPRSSSPTANSPRSMKEALALAKVKPLVIDYDDPEYSGAGERLGDHRIRGFRRGGRSGLRLDDAGRRMGRDLAQLHLGHHRRSEGRRLSPPRRVSARDRQRRHLQHGQASGLSVDAADVPLQRLVLSVVDLGRRRHACLPARGARGRRCSTRSPATRSRICAARRS